MTASDTTTFHSVMDKHSEFTVDIVVFLVGSGKGRTTTFPRQERGAQPSRRDKTGDGGNDLNPYN